MLLLYRIRFPGTKIQICLFTFHYASTLSVRVAVGVHIPNVFTFHYASTLSRSRSAQLQRMTNLHSTMLLLYLDHAQRWKDLLHIYIPLCFYFIEYSFLLTECGNSIYIPLCFYFIALSLSLQVI